MHKLALLLMISTILLTTGFSASTNSAEFVTNSSTITLNQFGSANTSYTVELMSGISGYSKINLTNIHILNEHGITISLTNMSGIPPFSGKLTINAGQNTLPMLYNLSVIVSGNDTQANPTILYINIIKQNNSTITNNVILPPNTTSNYIPLPPTPRLLRIAESNNTVNGLVGGKFSLGNVTAIISPNTYVTIGNRTYSNYNFSIILFEPQNMSISPLTANVSYAYGYAINGQISSNIKFTNSNGNIRNILTVLNGNATYTALPFGGGSYNSIVYSFGNYGYYMNWTYNSSTTIKNYTNASGAWVVFHSPFDLYFNHGLIDTGTPPQEINITRIPPNTIQTTTNGATTTILTTNGATPSNSNTSPTINSYLVYVAVAAIIVVIIFILYKKRHKVS